MYVSSEMTVKELDIGSGNVVQEWKEHAQLVTCLDFCERKLVTGSYDNAISIM